ncbi:TonB-linked SusC/RagA family outer membrane protein [Winogradskyella eximia]|uniref:TonB-linked SusC/RagA family outer membrane protein n=1 Tax=Winogradskyella eximia TaxID=262006 RepID=A0A3D9H1F3_9FLAO|nr:TonB-dependent receptor [Winogradskyella eximia]RED43314.1 TonB-linked SusC/RagA family outer membrane protein [Winogradskyella eximia]
MKLKLTWLLTLFMAFVMQFSFAQEKKTVTGTVTTASDELPLPGASVIVKGTSKGQQTDFDGKYSIQVNVGDVLVISYVGMSPAEIKIGASNTYNVALEDGNTLDEVVIVAYGEQKKESVLGAVSTVGAKDIEQVPIGSFDQILKGQSPGLHISSGSGQPGTSAKVRIRGTHSINGGSDPLYILDGVPITANDFATLNANDFENITVLKDAASTSIYGSRGSSGVILITSKRGTSGKSRVKYSTQYGISEIGQLRFEMMTGSEKMIFENWQTPGKWTDEDIATAPNTDWSDIFFRTGITQTHDFSVTGGNDKTQFFTSVGIYDQEGIGLRSDLQRFTARLNLDHKVSDRFKVGVSTSIGYSKSNFISSENGINLNNPFAAVYLSNPYDLPYNEDGSYNTGGVLIGGNALENLETNVSKRADLKLNISGNASLEIVKNVTARVSLGVDYRDRKSETGASPDTYFGQNAGFTGDQGGYSFTNSYIANINALTSLMYSNVFSDVHNVDVAAHVEYYKYHAKSGTFSGFGIDPKRLGYASGITAGTDTNGFIPEVGGGVTQRGLLGIFANAKYNYDSKYFAEFTIRRDASSRFSEANKWGTFYAVAAGWALHNEDFLTADWIDNLKLRASIGTTGNQLGIADFQDEGTYGTASYNGIAGISVASIGNNQLKWEESEKFNVGVDYGLFKNRLRGSLDYYIESISDLFIDQRLSGTSGFTSIDSNVGKMQNKGVDGQITGTVLQKKDFSWSLNFNFNYNKNEITDLGQVDEYELGTSIVREGLAFGSHYAVGWAGVNPANGQALYLDGDGNITDVFSDENALAKWGSYEPTWTGGFGTQINYKGFNVSAQFTWVNDYYRYNNQTFFQENPNFSNFNLSTAMLDIWRTPGQITDIAGFGNNREFSSADIEDASYMRLTNVTIGYTVDPEVLENINLFSGIRVYVQGQNLYTWTNFGGFDPEDDNNIAGYEYPTPRTITFGVDLNF